MHWRKTIAVSADLVELLRAGRRPGILVVGDVILARYVWGAVDRVSYEAPIPVFRADEREERLGGAGSVLAILTALEADVVLASVTGDDPEGRTVRRMVEQSGQACDCLLACRGRPTTVKERLLGRSQSRHPQQVIRVDREGVGPLDEQTEKALLEAIRRRLTTVDLVLVSDYDKGVCGENLLGRLMADARKAGVRVLVDPARGVDYRRYRGATCITPNRAESGLAVGRGIQTPEDGLAAARELLRLGLESVVVTLDRDGIAWAGGGGRSGVFPVRARQVYDITGAGDAVLAALGFGVALGADWPAAIRLANLAGGVEVQRLGVAPLTRRDLLEEIALGGFSTGYKIVSPQRLDEELRRRRRAGQRIVMTNGCFDLLHPGHVASLQHARSLGDCLVVGLNSDAGVARLKGRHRPVIDQQGRAAMLAALACVDYVVLFDQTSVAPLVERVLPDVLVKSSQYAASEVVGREIVEAHGGRVVLAPMEGNYSTSRLLERMRQPPGEESR